MPVDREEAIVYRDNLFFDEEYMRTFIMDSAEKGTCMPRGLLCG